MVILVSENHIEAQVRILAFLDVSVADTGGCVEAVQMRLETELGGPS